LPRLSPSKAERSDGEFRSSAPPYLRQFGGTMAQL
jgi:hypothetical protein